MKKNLVLLGLIVLTISAAAPRVAASDQDVGYQFTLPVDNNAVVTADCQAVITAPEFVVQSIERDPGDRYMELTPRLRSGFGLREESPANFSSLSQGDLTVNDFSLDRQCARLSIDNNRHNVNHSVISTSCGGIGY